MLICQRGNATLTRQTVRRARDESRTHNDDKVLHSEFGTPDRQRAVKNFKWGDVAVQLKGHMEDSVMKDSKSIIISLY
jgi:hypothetical protein